MSDFLNTDMTLVGVVDGVCPVSNQVKYRCCRKPKNCNKMDDHGGCEIEVYEDKEIDYENVADGIPGQDNNEKSVVKIDIPKQVLSHSI
jgi:hypothetical protein